jgi:hypothetical protein
MTIDNMVGLEVPEPTGAFTCDVCGYDNPHSHLEFDVIAQRFARKAFEKRYTEVVTSSWDGDRSKIVPQVRGPRPEDGYWGEEHNRRWQIYVGAWHDAWEHFDAQIKQLQVNLAAARETIRYDAHLTLSKQSKRPRDMQALEKLFKSDGNAK